MSVEGRWVPRLAINSLPTLHETLKAKQAMDVLLPASDTKTTSSEHYRANASGLAMPVTCKASIALVDGPTKATVQF